MSFLQGLSPFCSGETTTIHKHTDVHIQHMELDMTGYILIYLLRLALHLLRLISVANRAIASTGDQTPGSCRSGRFISIYVLDERDFRFPEGAL